MPTPSVSGALFRAYLAGRATPDEAGRVRAWLAEPAHQELARPWMQAHWETLAQAPAAALPDDHAAPDYERMLRKLHAQLGLPAVATDATEAATETAHLQLARPAAPTRWRWAAAAVVALAAGSGGWLWQQRAARPLAPALAQVQTGYGRTRALTLPDGSRVTLNGHSRLRYGNLGPGHAREVWLDGEGFFDVRHQADDRRFVVHTTAGWQVEVLGTRFGVLRRAAQARVVLLSGQVRVRFADARPAVLLAPGEVLETHGPALAAAPARVRAAAHPAAYTAWTAQKLVLDETPIRELAQRLRDTYGLDVQVPSEALAERRVTGTVPVGDLNLLLDALRETCRLRVQRRGTTLLLLPD